MPTTYKQQDDDRVDAHPQHLATRPEDQPAHVDDGQQRAERGEVDVAGAPAAGSTASPLISGGQEQDRQEGVATEDVTDRQLVVAQSARR